MEELNESKFPTTRWTIVGRASCKDGSARRALESLCSIYWYPLFAFLRSRGHSPEDAEDLTQGCLARLLESEGFAVADPEKGKFRTFLLTAVTRHAGHERRKGRAAKRGGGEAVHVPLELADAERRYRETAGGIEPELSPESSFDRAWALSLLRIVLGKLATEAARKGRQAEFSLVKPHLLGMTERPDYPAIAAELGIGESAAKMRVHRLKVRYRERLREEIAETLDQPTEAEINEELRYLASALGSLGASEIQ